MRVPLAVRMLPAATFRAWLSPPPRPARSLQRDQEATAGLASFLAGDVAGFEVGSGPLVLALHGWGGRPAQMVAPARALAAEGYRVVIPELPGHAGGEPTDIKRVSAAVRALVAEIGRPEIVVAHSFAAMVLRLAFASEPPPFAVLIAPALAVEDALEVFGDRLALFPWARRGLRSRLERWDPILWPTIAAMDPEQLPGTEIIILHDPDDDETSFARSADLAAVRPGTKLVVTTGVGHSRILSDPSALGEMVRSLRAGSTPG